MYAVMVLAELTPPITRSITAISPCLGEEIPERAVESVTSSAGVSFVKLSLIASS
jgi:hypothetical protein